MIAPSGLLVRGTADAFEARLAPAPERRVMADPADWTAAHGGFLWSKQREIARSVVENRMTLVPACHGPGKSYVAGELGAWWIDTFEDVRLVTTAPSEPQVKAILWAELAKAKASAGVRGRITSAAQWWAGPRGAEVLIGFGRKPQDLKNREQAMQAFQGIHADRVLIIIDEATGVPGWLWDAAIALMTNDKARLLAIGNPDDPGSRFAQECEKPIAGTNVIRIPADSTPNFTGEWVPDYLRDLLVSKLWVEEARQRWGVDNPLYQSKVLALFPESSDDAVIPMRLIRKAWATDLEGALPGAYGFDVARMGEDKSALYRSRGGVVRLVDEWGKTDTVEGIDKAWALTRHTPNVPVVIDADGLGAAMFDQARRPGKTADGQDRPAMPMVAHTVNEPPRDPLTYWDRRSEVWWEFRLAIEAGLVDLDPSDETLAAQLAQPKWKLQGGRIRVESKDEMRKRGKPSPDRADAAIMADQASPKQSLSDYARALAEAAGEQEPGLTDDLRERSM